jgi:very-short-patch-repair endonuclease
MTKLYNRTDEKNKRKMLRSTMPEAEVILWSKLKGKSLNGYKFRRQYSIEKFVVDFYCPELKLAIEVDGDSHYREGAEQRDREREAVIESYGISFLRFTNRQVVENVDGVLHSVMQYIEELNAETD